MLNELHDTPKDWSLIRFKYLCILQKGQLPSNLSDEPLTDSYIPYLSMEYLRGSEPAKNYLFPEKDITIAKENDLLLLWDGSNAGEFINSKYGAVSSTMVLIKPTKINARYFLYACKVAEQLIQSETVGMGIPHVNSDHLSSIRILVPPLVEQTEIAQYLDSEVVRIDSLIKAKKHFLTLLEERRRTIITDVIRQGIYPSIKTKDYGIKWLGKIPEHWRITRLKFITSKIGSGKTPKGGAEVYSTEGIPFIRSQNVHFSGLVLDDLVFISLEIDAEMSSTRIQSNDVLLNITGASIGRCCVFPTLLQKGNVNQHVSIIRVNGKKILPDFLKYFIESNLGQIQISLQEEGVSREGLSSEDIGNFVLPLPEIVEQKQILDDLSLKLKQIEEIKIASKYSIELLSERRSTLISEAVTGKLKIN